LIESEKLIIFFAVIDDPAVTYGELFWSKKKYDIGKTRKQNKESCQAGNGGVELSKYELD